MSKLVLLGFLALAAGSALAGDAGQIAQIESGSRALPVYPPAAYAARYECSVVVAAVIHEDGTVGEVEVMEATAPKLGFEEATIDAIKQWRFEPARLNGEPVASVAAYELNFRRTPGGGGGAVVTGYHLVSQFAPGRDVGMGRNPLGDSVSSDAAYRSMSPSEILKRSGAAPDIRLSHGVATIDIPPEARQCEMCVYSREGIIPPRYRAPSRTASN
jgi:TonB family protein